MSQSLLYQHNCGNSVSYDMVTQFGLHPVEFLQVFNSLGKYFCWFHIKKVPMVKAVMRKCLCIDIAKCTWIDCLGCEVHLQQRAFQKVRTHVQLLDVADGLHLHSQELIKLVLRLTSYGEGEGRKWGLYSQRCR